MSHSPRVPASDLSASQKALARSRTYGLLGRLYLDGLDEENLAGVRAVTDLAVASPEPFQGDEAAADHQRLFGFNVFPYESIFLDVSGLLGGEVTDKVVASYQTAGFGGWEGSEGADHIGHELTFLAFLCGAEHEAREGQLQAVAGSMVARQADFLARHLLRWLPPLVLAIRQQGHAFYTALADLTLEVVADQWSEAAEGEEISYVLPSRPDLLGQEKTGLKEIAAYLLTPAYSGLYLSRDDLGRLARRGNLPRGFGGRQNMLLNLLRSAANYEGIGVLLTGLRDMAAGWAQEYGEMPSGEAWGARAESTARLLEEMIDRAATADLPDD